VSGARGFWLVKSEPDVFSFEDLWRAPRRRTFWDGVRNYQARNFLRDAVRPGDGVLFYHSNGAPPGIAGLAEVASAAAPDPTQFDARDPHHDPASDPADPRWFGVEVRAVERLPRFLSLDELRAAPALATLGVLRRGNRLSVQPVSAAEWRAVRALAGLPRVESRSRRAARGR
jgi:predicted RNA-binding protein with PUA-like domain